VPPPPRTPAQGGYHLGALGEGAAESFRGLLGLPPASPPPAELAQRRLLQPEPLGRVERALAEVRRLHKLP
jgi:hypothetical protein